MARQRKLSEKEQRQIDYLEKQKDALIFKLMGAVEEINEQIKGVKNGEWIKKVEGDK